MKPLDWIRLYLSIVNTRGPVPQWILWLNSLQTIFGILCIALLKTNDKKQRNIAVNNFHKKYRLVMKTITVKIDGVDYQMRFLARELREGQTE